MIAAPHSAMDYGDWVLNHWWPAQADLLSEGTLNNYRTTLNRYVIPHFELVPLDAITRGSVQAWMDILAQQGATQGTINAAVRVFRTTMMAAMVKGLISSNPLR